MNKISLIVALGILVTACQSAPPAPTTLKDAYEDYFYIGAALNPSYFAGQNELGMPALTEHFNSITPENHMKWQHIHPQPDTYDFEMADQYVEFGEERGDFIIGHTLVWHSQTPRWVFQHEDGTPLTRDELLARMEDHIKTVVGRYKGRVDGWDVVNEALNDDGTMRNSPWYRIIGDDFIIKAFEFAHEADPDAELYYNDYSLNLPAKADGAVRIIESLKEAGVYYTGVGMQGHYGLDGPTAKEFETSIEKFEKLGTVAITELDLDVLPSPWEHMGADVNMTAELRAELNPYTEGLPDSVAELQTAKFVELFEVMLKHSDAINRVTLWGVTDNESWKNGWPIQGRTNYCLLFDRQGEPKPAVPALIELANNYKK